MKNEQSVLLRGLFGKHLKLGLLNILQIVICVILGGYVYDGNFFPPIVTDIVVALIALACLSLIFYLNSKRAKLLVKTDKKFSESGDSKSM